MRLTGFDAPHDLPASQPMLGTRSSVKRVNTILAALGPYRDRFERELKKHPKLVAGLTAAGDVWSKLVGAFCAIIDPYLSRFFPDQRLVALVTASGEVQLHRITKASATLLGHLAAMSADQRRDIAQTKWTALELRLRSDQLLQRTLSLPAASRGFLGPIIEHRLERLTPWRPDRVLYGFQTLEGPEPGVGVGVVITATSKDLVAAPLRALDDAGLVVTAIGAHEDSLGEPLRVNLLRDAAKAKRAGSCYIVSRVALTSFCLLAVVYLGSALWASRAIDAWQEANRELLKARRLLKAASVGPFSDRERALLDGKRPDTAVVVLIDKLANAIPADTFLKELAVTPDKVRLAGISGNAPALVRELESVGLINVRFTSAVTREKDHRDSFEISADRASPVSAETP